MTAADDMKAKLVTLGSALDNIAADVAALKAQIGTGMSDADVADIQAKIDAIAAAAQTLADSTPDAPPV